MCTVILKLKTTEGHLKGARILAPRRCLSCLMVDNTTVDSGAGVVSAGAQCHRELLEHGQSRLLGFILKNQF